ncbi:putative cysteine dioxygenase [Ixodes scapularis]
MELTDAGNYKPPSASSLADLIEQLHRVFESDHINVEYVHDLMLSYKSNPKEWQKYAKFDRHSLGPDACRRYELEGQSRRRQKGAVMMFVMFLYLSSLNQS